MTPCGLPRMSDLVAAGQVRSEPRSITGRVELPGAVQAATARAQLALDTLALAQLCLLRSAAPLLRSGTAARAAGLFNATAMSYLHCFATTPILYWGSSGCDLLDELG